MVVFREGQLNYRSMGPHGNTWLGIIVQVLLAADLIPNLTRI